MKDMLKIGYIGHGGRGKYHIKNFLKMPDCEVEFINYDADAMMDYVDTYRK